MSTERARVKVIVQAIHARLKAAPAFTTPEVPTDCLDAITDITSGGFEAGMVKRDSWLVLDEKVLQAMLIAAYNEGACR